jgi:hypothetical protein
VGRSSESDKFSEEAVIGALVVVRCCESCTGPEALETPALPGDDPEGILLTTISHRIVSPSALGTQTVSTWNSSLESLGNSAGDRGGVVAMENEVEEKLSLRGETTRSARVITASSTLDSCSSLSSSASAPDVEYLWSSESSLVRCLRCGSWMGSAVRGSRGTGFLLVFLSSIDLTGPSANSRV